MASLKQLRPHPLNATIGEAINGVRLDGARYASFSRPSEQVRGRLSGATHSKRWISRQHGRRWAETSSSSSGQLGEIQVLDEPQVSAQGDGEQVVEQRTIDELLERAARPDETPQASENGGAKESAAEENRGLQVDGASQLESGDHGLSRGTIIWRALKLPLYTVALIPLMVGAGLARFQYGVFHASRFVSFLFFSVLVLAWLNLSNDAFDAETGVDVSKPESVVNLTGSRMGVLVSAFALLAVGLAGLFSMASQAGDGRVFPLLAVAIACGYVYQCPPFRLSYLGLGEPLCFLAFGPLATTAFYLFQAGSPGSSVPITAACLAASVLTGITTTLILLCSHFHQVDSDRSVGKLSPLVRMGTATGARLVVTSVAALSLLSLAFVVAGVLPPACLAAPLLSLPVSRAVSKFVLDHHEDKQVIFMAKYMCTRLHIVFGTVLSAALALSAAKPLNI